MKRITTARDVWNEYYSRPDGNRNTKAEDVAATEASRYTHWHATFNAMLGAGWTYAVQQATRAHGPAKWFGTEYYVS